ncbi:DUF4837 family protein [Flavobacterium sp. N3904]|uniref:DUF4837 family protein n=1 Tax=Flavobacterium sp. N3904 TaxID=2986835 RepID=UPI002224A122|nr:DUF4837 family protein [Flavobacterium sp. N3904]
MNKIAVLFLIVFPFFLSCSKKEDKLSRTSSGNINSISVVIDDKLWNGVVGDSIRNKFAAPVEGLPKEEPLFDINQYPLNFMEGFMTNSRSIIVIKKGDSNSFSINKNQYASPQNVFHITGNSVAAILDVLEKNAPNIIQIIKKGEIVEHQRLLSDSISNPKSIQNQFKITLKIPSSYSYIIRNNDFVWFKREFVGGSNSLLISELPLNALKNKSNLSSRILKIQDSISALYVKGADSLSKMYIDKSYPIYFLKTKIDVKTTYQTKGTWRLRDSFMFGSYVNYFIEDPDKNRVLFIAGFSYFPSKDKRDYMHELESIIEGVQIQ